MKKITRPSVSALSVPPEDLSIKTACSTTSSAPKRTKPDAYYGMQLNSIPDDYVLSINDDGSVLTMFRDLRWSFPQLKLVITDKVDYDFSGLYSDDPLKAHNLRVAQNLLLHRIFSSKGSAKLIRASTLNRTHYAILHISKFASDNNETVERLVNRKELYSQLIKSLHYSRAKALLQCLRIFSSTKSNEFWFPIGKDFFSDLKSICLGNEADHKQHAVIPPRILHLRWQHYKEVLNDFMLHLDNYKTFVSKVLSDQTFARSINYQRQLRQKLPALSQQLPSPTFDEAVKLHNLDHLFSKYQHNTLIKAFSFLALVQYCAKSLIHILTLMRNGEALLLERGCTELAQGWNEVGVYIIGISTKATGSAVDTKWITTEAIKFPLQVLNEVFEIVHPHLPKKHEHVQHLFISPSNLPYTTSRPALINNCELGRFDCKLPPILIEKQDLKILELIDPVRDWLSEDDFQIGQPWNFTCHQFRRTMCFYCSEQEFVTLPAMKREMAHLSEITTQHYQKGCSAGVFKMSQWAPELIADFKSIALEASNAIYIRDIILSEEKLLGPEGTRIQEKNDTNNNVLSDTIAMLEERKRKGLIACTRTPVGLCMSVHPCIKRAHADFTTCDGCSEAVILLSKLDYIIETLRYDLQGHSPDLLVYRMDAQTLKDFEQMRDRLLVKNATIQEVHQSQKSQRR
ncbi:hypothetical protein [Pseudomonas sp.]|uniref:hypothetical protein n=1 Tax=Pseudomonas sp. TaxID=306 RepID=UPI003263D29F